jgi:hypothetical protein
LLALLTAGIHRFYDQMYLEWVNRHTLRLNEVSATEAEEERRFVYTPISLRTGFVSAFKMYAILIGISALGFFVEYTWVNWWSPWRKRGTTQLAAGQIQGKPRTANPQIKGDQHSRLRRHSKWHIVRHIFQTFRFIAWRNNWALFEKKASPST